MTMKVFGPLMAVAVLLIACTAEPTPDELLADIRQLETELQSLDAPAEEERVGTTVEQILAKSRAFVEAYPRDTAAATVLFRAANVAHGAQRYAEATELWARVVADYPGFERAPDALFLQGFMADQDMGEAETAERHYEAFLQAYPEHPLARDVALLLQMLQSNQRPEDLIRTFETPPDSTSGPGE